ncbi:cytochrome c oxidase assembly protein [Clavibacter zhangzhiyongii]|uniref:Bifunctional copper resistance protein CopD/cytochrome c oxidase assembly protein n=1 Tax=Clavibacter zhangzhiyongii TaxID=2768071 RepID=A0A7L7YYV2_9MICO|nr:cytochrome c oxidase assembly protein [Clavibacter zhangzhiyongii]QOD42660.1 bifunctional copper resistance protein CopD/cytochrome c oxidase assembly protein [Clavibacter zhangzhiyongii]
MPSHSPLPSVDPGTHPDDPVFEQRTLALPRVRPRDVALWASLPLAVAVMLAAAALTGATARTLLVYPGDFVTYALPTARVIHDAAASVTIGLLVVAAFALPGQRKHPGMASFAQWKATRWASHAAAVWLAASIAVLGLSGANVIGVPLTSPTFRGQFGYFTLQLELGQTLLASLMCVAVVFGISVWTRRTSGTGIAAGVALASLLPLSLSGHAAGTYEHANAVNSLGIHLIGVTVWAGGLVAVILCQGLAKASLPTVVSRYSMLAGWSFAAVALSGIVNASLRIGTPLDLVTTAYGALLLVKTAFLIALGLAGFAHRRIVIPGLVRDATRRTAFIRLAVGEVVVMSVAMGISVALSRSEPPVPQTTIADVDPLASLIGFTFPDPVTPLRMLTAFHPDFLFLSVAAVMAGLYLVGVARLRRRGDAWSAARTVPWMLGCAMLVYATSGGPGVYGAVHFSTHMIQHMLLMMYVPPLLVLGAPILLILRVLPARQDSSRGIREWVLAGTHSRYAQLVTHPVVAAVVFAGSLVAFYYTPWFEWSLSTHQGHMIMSVHFLISGYLFFFVLIGVDPGPRRPAYPIRLMLLLATMAFHAFFGLAIMSGTEILAIDWWHQLGLEPDAQLLADQAAGGGIAWGAGELPVVLVALMVVRQWSTSETRAAKRYDRAAARDGDAELNAYNARLSALDEHTHDPRRIP